MISLIVSSKSDVTYRAFEENIRETIGVPYEILCCENYTGEFGLATVYNRLAAKAQYAYLLFIHEDVAFYSKNWGTAVIRILQDKHIGLLGLLGSNMLTRTPSGWAKQDKKYNYGTVYQKGDPVQQLEDRFNQKNDTIHEVLSIDGVFIATRKEVWQEIPFDAVNTPAFHGYDFQYSMLINQKYKVVVTDAIILEHFSKGNFNKEWIDITIKLNKLWTAQLPRAVNLSLSSSEQTNAEFWQAAFMLNCLQGIPDDTTRNEYITYIIKQFYSNKLLRYPLKMKLQKMAKPLQQQ